MVRLMICEYIDAYRSKFKEFITGRISSLLREFEEAEVMGRKYRISGIQ